MRELEIEADVPDALMYAVVQNDIGHMRKNNHSYVSLIKGMVALTCLFISIITAVEILKLE